MKTGLGSLQGVIFVKGFDLSDSLSVAQALNVLTKIKFSGNPTILPIPSDAPQELPRIILKTNDNQFNINVSPIRIDLRYENIKYGKDGEPVGKLEDVESLFVSTLSEIATIVQDKFSARVSRLALIANHVFKFDESSKKYFLEKFIKGALIKNPHEIQLNILLKKEIGKYKINEWLRFHTLRNKKDLADDTALLFVQDLNTLAEIDYQFDKESTKEFIKSCFTLVKSGTDQYTR